MEIVNTDDDGGVFKELTGWENFLRVCESVQRELLFSWKKDLGRPLLTPDMTSTKCVSWGKLCSCVIFPSYKKVEL